MATGGDENHGWKEGVDDYQVEEGESTYALLSHTAKYCCGQEAEQE